MGRNIKTGEKIFVLMTDWEFYHSLAKVAVCFLNLLSSIVIAIHLIINDVIVKSCSVSDFMLSNPICIDYFFLFFLFFF